MKRIWEITRRTFVIMAAVPVSVTMPTFTPPWLEPCPAFSNERSGGRTWIRTREGVSQQIYSLPSLAT
jgi:hypothetical protein